MKPGEMRSLYSTYLTSLLFALPTDNLFNKIFVEVLENWQQTMFVFCILGYQAMAETDWENNDLHYRRNLCLSSHIAC